MNYHGDFVPLNKLFSFIPVNSVISYGIFKQALSASKNYKLTVTTIKIMNSKGCSIG